MNLEFTFPAVSATPQELKKNYYLIPRGGSVLIKKKKKYVA